MKILLNASTINVGGGLFVTVNFIKHTIKYNYKDIEWFYILSKEVKDELSKIEITIPDSKQIILNASPASTRKRFQTVPTIKDVEKVFDPDLVYSIGAPSYINFSTKEVQRLTNPYITHPNKYALNTYSWPSKLGIILKTKFQRWIIKNDRYFITQTKTAKSGIIDITGTDPSNVFVVPNSLSETFRKNEDKFQHDKKSNYIFCLAAPYPHKNLDKIPETASLLKSMTDKNFRFILTIPFGDPLEKQVSNKAKEYGVSRNIKNVGKITQEDCAEWYSRSKVVFLPTYLETFSATYLEALFMQVPIVTADFDFSREVCGKYAKYFEPEDWAGAAKEIDQILSNEVSNLCISKKEFNQNFFDYEDTFEITIEIFSDLAEIRE